MWKFQEIFLLSFLIAAVLTPLLREAAFQFGILDYPKHYGVHSKPVPRLGGLAIYLAFVIGSLYRMDLSHMLKGILLGSSIIFFVGLVDDLIHLRAGFKLAAQLAACAVMMFKYGVILDVFPNVFLNGFFTALGLIGVTNAVNFLDNMDGLAAGLVAVSSAAIFIVAYTTKQFWLGYLSIALVGAAAGFLLFNLRKAHVFMGDAGSTFLGFTLASLAVMTEWSRHLSVTLAAPLLILGIPVLDMFLITVLRIKEDKVRNFREWIDYTGKDHLSHRLVRLGLGERGAVFCLWLVQAAFCGIGLAVLPKDSPYGTAGLVFFLFVAMGLALFFRKRRTLLLHFNRKTSSPRRPPSPRSR